MLRSFHEVKHKFKQFHGRKDLKTPQKQETSKLYVNWMGQCNGMGHWHVLKNRWTHTENMQHVLAKNGPNIKNEVNHGKSTSYSKFKYILPKDPLVCPFRKGFPRTNPLGMEFLDHQSNSIRWGLDD